MLYSSFFFNIHLVFMEVWWPIVVSVPASIDYPSWVRISVQGLPTVLSEGRHIAILYCTNKVQHNHSVLKSYSTYRTASFTKLETPVPVRSLKLALGCSAVYRLSRWNRIIVESWRRNEQFRRRLRSRKGVMFFGSLYTISNYF